MVRVRFDNGALATAEASFQAVYGYDVRGEVFGSDGMVTAGDVHRTSMTFYGEKGVVHDTVRHNTDLFHDAYTDELAHFVDCVRNGTVPECTGEDARSALGIALASIESVQSGRSEEHTSELQSRQYLVCRLLLEKKKKRSVRA